MRLLLSQPFLLLPAHRQVWRGRRRQKQWPLRRLLLSLRPWRLLQVVPLLPRLFLRRQWLFFWGGGRSEAHPLAKDDEDPSWELTQAWKN